MEGSPWLTLRRPPMTGWVPGAALVVLGVGVPAPALLHLFRPEAGAQHDDLLLGVLLFKAGLAVIGLLEILAGALLLALMGGAGMLSIGCVLPIMGREFDRYGPGAALKLVAILPAVLTFVFAGLYLYFKARGGYRPIVLEAAQES